MRESDLQVVLVGEGLGHGADDRDALGIAGVAGTRDSDRLARVLDREALGQRGRLVGKEIEVLLGKGEKHKRERDQHAKDEGKSELDCPVDPGVARLDRTQRNQRIKIAQIAGSLCPRVARQRVRCPAVQPRLGLLRFHIHPYSARLPKL